VLEAKRSTLGTVVEARKEKIEAGEAWVLLSGSERIVVARGKKILSFEPEDEIREEILKLCLGRSGTLRAPSLKIGSLMLVGFNDAMYTEYIEDAEA